MADLIGYYIALFHLIYRSSLNPDERKAYGDSPFFGINLGVDQCGSIKVGDKVIFFYLIKIVIDTNLLNSSKIV